MTSSAQTATSETLPAPEPKRSMFCYPWMAGRNFDLLWYFAPIFVAIAASYLIRANPAWGTGLLFLFVANAFGVGPAHQGPTWFFYFDKRNREHWSQDRMRVLLYYFAPALVFVVSIVLALYVPWLSLLVTTLWGIQHFVQQNFGITLLYHNKNNNEAIPERNLLLRSLWTPAIFFIAIFFHHVWTTPSALSGSGASAATIAAKAAPPMDAWVIGVFAILGVVALYDVSRVLLHLRAQVGSGARINVPAFMFWAVSVLYYVPYLLPGQTLATVSVIPGTMHWFQYIGLNMILIKQKYGESERESDIPCGATKLMVVLCVGSTLFFLLSRGIQQDFAVDSFNWRLLLGVYFGLANVHYFQDAFFWKFREKFQRESIMPFLMKARNV
jgi:hypothetical protein